MRNNAITSFIVQLNEENPLPASYTALLVKNTIVHIKKLEETGVSELNQEQQQGKMEDIFNDNALSTLEKIGQCASLGLNKEDNHSQLLAFVAFQYILTTLIDRNMVDMDRMKALRIDKLDNHFVVVLENKIICDPFVGQCYLSDDLARLRIEDKAHDWHFFQNDLKPFFEIDDTWLCKKLNTDQQRTCLDERSMEYTYNLFQSKPSVYKNYSLFSKSSDKVNSETDEKISPPKPPL